MQNRKTDNMPFDSKRPQIETKQEKRNQPLKSGIVKITLGDKTIGIVANNAFIKNLHSSRHFLRKPEAICFDIESIEKVVKLGAKLIKILDLDTGRIYEASIALLKEKGIHINRGFGDQIALPLRYWKCEERNRSRQ
jgi:hypothetical protein